MNHQELESYIKNIPDFPKPGIIFKDISALIKNHFPQTLSLMQAELSASQWKKIDYIAGVESRGFLFAAGLASLTQKGLIPIRKKGKLPPPTNQLNYELEYGSNCIEMTPGTGSILLVDDIIATGGTLTAAYQLANQSGYTIQHSLVLMNLCFLNTCNWNLQQPIALLNYWQP